MKVANYEKNNPYSVKDFVVDRVACGIPIHESLNQLKINFNVEMNELDFKKLFPEYEKEIKEKQNVFAKELEEHRATIVDRINKHSKEIEDVMTDLKAQGKYKYFAQVAGQLTRSLELLARSVGQIKSTQETNINLVSIGKSYLQDLFALEKMNVIEIKDNSRLRLMFGLNETEILNDSIGKTTETKDPFTTDFSVK